MWMQRSMKRMVLMLDFNARIGLGVEDGPNSNGKRLLGLVRLGDFVVGKKLQWFEGRWTLENGEKKSVIDYILFVKAWM